MNRRVIGILLAGLLAGIALSGAYRHFVTGQIMDGGSGMENPDTVREDELQILDGDHTYVDNSALWPVLEGVWESGDGRWQAVLSERDGLRLTRDGAAVLAEPLDFTYLQPGKVTQTELRPEDRTLRTAEGTELGWLAYLTHRTPGEPADGTLVMELELPDGKNETVTLMRSAAQAPAGKE